MMSAEAEITPVYAQGFYIVTQGAVQMVIVFDYVDKGQYYQRLLRKGGEELAKEVDTVWQNMQSFMDDEIVRVNGQRVRPLIHDVYIGLRGPLPGPTSPSSAPSPPPSSRVRTYMKITTKKRWPSTTTRLCGYFHKTPRWWSGTSTARWRPLSRTY